MSAPRVAVASAGVVLSGLLGGCGASAPAPPSAVPPSAVPHRAASTAPVSAPATDSTNPSNTSNTSGAAAQPADSFRPVPAGSDLTQLVTPLGRLLRIDPRTLEVALVPGTAEPGGTFPEGGQVPLARRGALVAATSFKRADARGGEVVDGRTVGTLRPGAATLVVRSNGTFDVGAWNTPHGVTPAPGDVVVVQNLSLLVDQGQAVPDLGTDILGRWGLTFRPAVPVSVWRSGLGIDARGRLLYAAGPNLVPAQLAELLLSGGAVRAMQLDINHLWVFAIAFAHPDPSHPESVQGQALLPGMTPSVNHVLAPGARDFIAVYRRVTH